MAYTAVQGIPKARPELCRIASGGRKNPAEVVGTERECAKNTHKIACNDTDSRTTNPAERLCGACSASSSRQAENARLCTPCVCDSDAVPCITSFYYFIITAEARFVLPLLLIIITNKTAVKGKE